MSRPCTRSRMRPRPGRTSPGTCQGFMGCRPVGRERQDAGHTARSCSVWPSVRRNMAERVHELLLRNLQEVFGEGDPTKRRSAIKELYTDDCVLYVPPGTFVGHDALDKFAGDLRATHPHFAYAPHAAPQALQNAGRLKWGSGPRGGVPAYTGEDVIIVRDEKIAALYVFLDSPPA